MIRLADFLSAFILLIYFMVKTKSLQADTRIEMLRYLYLILKVCISWELQSRNP